MAKVTRTHLTSCPSRRRRVRNGKRSVPAAKIQEIYSENVQLRLMGELGGNLVRLKVIGPTELPLAQLVLLPTTAESLHDQLTR